jgi:class 3 adenylate cyclase
MRMTEEMVMPIDSGQRKPSDLAVPGDHVAVLFTDVVGSTALWSRDPNAMNEALAEHDSIVLETLVTGGGSVFANPGDSFGAAFSEVDQAVVVAGDVLAGLAWATSSVRLLVRIGIHWGDVIRRRGNLFGLTVCVAARLASVAEPDEILLSANAARQLSTAPSSPTRRVRLRGLATPIDARAVDLTKV